MASQRQPLVTVVTPVYNGEKYLAQSIESVLAQTYQNWEYVIVNNCSTDRSRAIAAHYAAKDSRVRIHDNTQFVGVIANYNNDVSQYWEWSDTGIAPIDLSNEAYKLGVNYVIYAMTH